MKKFLYQYKYTLIIGAFIVFVSFINTSRVSSHNIWDYKGSDKLIHFMMYFTLGFFCFFEKFRKLENKTSELKFINNVIPILIIISIGGLIEIAQPIFSTRSCEFFDFVANSVGTISSFYLYKNIHHKIKF